MTTTSPAELWKLLQNASHEANAKVTPRPIIVGSPTTPFGNDIDPTKETWYHSEGICGWSIVRVPNRGKFAKWLLDNDLAYKPAYESGLVIRDYERNGFAKVGQSYERHLAVNNALLNVLLLHGITATGVVGVD